jgi:hypothetical protein
VLAIEAVTDHVSSLTPPPTLNIDMFPLYTSRHCTEEQTTAMLLKIFKVAEQ